MKLSIMMNRMLVTVALLLLVTNGHGLDDDDGIDDNEDCKTCRSVVKEFIKKRREGNSHNNMRKIVMELCLRYTNKGEDYCEGIIRQQLDVALYIVDKIKTLNGARVCNIYLQNKMCQYPNRTDWTIELPEKSENIITLNKSCDSNGRKLKILHLSDVHFDNKYTPGTNSRCSQPICCHNDSGIPTNPNNAAGYWGSYGKCDIPWHTVQEVLNRIKITHDDIDFVYYTGDVIAHTNFETSTNRNRNQLTKFYQALKKTFGSIPVYPVLGNNEPHPPHFYPPNNVDKQLSLKWLFDVTITEWSSWFSSEETHHSLRRGGFYTLLLKPGYRLIGLNNNMCLTSNLWLIYNDKDPYDELQWFVQILHEAEKKGERVHIIGHIELGEISTYNICTREFNRILRRFADIITVQINGHAHLDEFKLVYDQNKTEEIMYAFTGGSCTTYIGLNPNYRIYTVDSQTFKIDDYDQYTFNLTEANLNPHESPNWYKQYSFLEEYNLTEISPKSLGQLYRDMTRNVDLARKYYNNQIRFSDLYLNRCNANCLQNKLCNIVNIDYEDALQCHRN